MSQAPRLSATRMVTTTLALLAVLFAACSDNSAPLGSDENPAIVQASDYDQSCETGADCVLVAEQACLECNSNCALQSAIRDDALSEFNAAKDAIECEANSTANCNNDCGGMSALCLANTCTPWQGDPTSQPLPQTCTKDEDCIAIDSWAVDNCWSDSCPDFAVNKADWEKAAGIDCSAQPQDGPPAPSECDTPTRPACDQGTCTLVK